MNLRAFPNAGFCGLVLLGVLGLSTGTSQTGTGIVPVEGVEILVENVDNGRTAATRTGDAGQFSLSGLEPGEYRLIIGMIRQDAVPFAAGTDDTDEVIPVGYDVRLSVYGGAITAQWVPFSSPKMRVGIVFAVPPRASGTIAGSIRPASPPAVQTQITWVVPPAFID